ncbi:MAG: TIGR00645 family protein [Rhizomicrobium sp.]
MRQRLKVEVWLETILFQARWVVAPFYLGLVLSLFLLLATFCSEIVEFVHHFTLDPEAVILVVLSLIDLSLAGNLVIIVIFSGYENFVSKIDTGASEDRPSWMGTLDFSGLKMKLIGSIVAISVISLLRAFMKLTQPGEHIDDRTLAWLIGLHVTFLVSGLLFAVMDRIASDTESKTHHE